jgi:hypothetical protein
MVGKLLNSELVNIKNVQHNSFIQNAFSLIQFEITHQEQLNNKLVNIESYNKSSNQ